MSVEPKEIAELVEAALAADYTRVRRMGNRIAKQLADVDPETAQKIRSLLRKRGVPLQTSGYAESLPVDARSRLPLVDERSWPDRPIFLDDEGRNVFESFLDDARHADLLAERGLSTPLCLMLSGPPGTGKSVLAGHIAAQLGRPFYVARLDSVISSLLGETAKNIRSVFDFAPARDAVLFLDEIDAIAKLRDDRNELGEIKRVVNTFIQGLDSLDDSTIVLGATNHPHLLDPAIWRRFPYKIETSYPSKKMRADLWSHFLFDDMPENQAVTSLAQLSEGLSGADIETVALAARRRAALRDHPLDLAGVAWAIIQTETGKPASPPGEPLTPAQKRRLIYQACEAHGLTQAKVARLIGLTRQGVRHYLTEAKNG